MPADVAAAIAPEEHEKLLAWAVEDGSGVTVVAGRHRLYAVAPGPDGPHLTLSRPWHLVDAGLWSGEDGSLRVTWVDGERPARFVLTDPGLLPETLRERVQASVVSPSRSTSGNRRTARVVVRRGPRDPAPCSARRCSGRGCAAPTRGCPSRSARAWPGCASRSA